MGPGFESLRGHNTQHKACMKPELAKIDVSLQERKKAIHNVSKIRDDFDSLQGNLYTIADKKILNEEVYRYRIDFNEDCEIFKVHFPSQPIAPGGCVLDIAKELIEDFLNQKMSLKEARDIRFYGLLSPTVSVDFYFEKEELPVDKDAEEQKIEPFYRVFVVLRKKDTLQDSGILAEMHLVLQEKNH